MKRRQGWVSNSSSSSFICDVCGCVESGYDASASDFDMSYFDCGHIICNDEYTIDPSKLSLEQRKEIIDSYDKNTLQYDLSWELYGKADWKLEEEQQAIILKKVEEKISIRTDDYYTDEVVHEWATSCDEVPKIFCPVCNLEEISDTTLFNYVVNTMNISTVELKDTIRSKFRNLDELKTFLKGN